MDESMGGDGRMMKKMRKGSGMRWKDERVEREFY